MAADFCQDTKKEKTTIKGNFDKDVEVELDKTVYQYSLRLYETPYATNYIVKSLKKIIEFGIITKDSTIIIETDDEKRIIEQIKSLKVNIVDQRKYGRAYLIFLREK